MISIKKQNGAALIVSLIFLVIMTLFAITSLRNSTLDERSAAAYQFKTDTTQAAELAIGEVLRNYVNDKNSGNQNHIFKQAWDAAQEIQYPHGSLQTTPIWPRVDSLVSGVLPKNAKALYQSSIDFDRYMSRKGDDTASKSMLYDVSGSGGLSTGSTTKNGPNAQPKTALAKRYEGISLPSANIRGLSVFK